VVTGSVVVDDPGCDTAVPGIEGFTEFSYPEFDSAVLYDPPTPETDCITSLTLSTVGLTTLILPSSSVAPILTE